MGSRPNRPPRPEDWLVRFLVIGATVGIGVAAQASDQDTGLDDWRDALSVPELSEWRDSRSADPFEAEAEECPPGAWCDPLRIDSQSFVDHNTTVGGVREADHYACDPGVDASGPERVYEIVLDGPSVLTASVHSPEFVDVDLQLLRGLGPGGCRARGDSELSVVLSAGRYWLSVDTFVDRHGEEAAGEYDLKVDLQPLPSGSCAMAPREQQMYWPACADGLDCQEREVDGRPATFAHLPALGPVAREAHLVTTADPMWPTSPLQGIQAHYRATSRASGMQLALKEPWAPSPTGGVYARGSYGKPIPPEAEAWYVNMFWMDKPRPGERMILINPENGRAVVAAAGYETGPRSNQALGGASEEIHHVLGTVHLDELVMGYAADQTLPYGPIDCTELEPAAVLD